jgi:microcystin-dependent protein
MESYIGEIKMFGGNFAPVNFALCNGQLMSIAQNTTLFSIIGTYYGGDGVTTFALPNLQSRIPVHQGTGIGLSNYVLGEATGTENITISQQQMPAHNHMMRAVVAAGADQGIPTNNYLSVIQDPNTGAYTNFYADTTPDVTMNSNAITMAGSSLPVEIVQPVLAISFIICLYGIYPSRN